MINSHSLSSEMIPTRVSFICCTTSLCVMVFPHHSSCPQQMVCSKTQHATSKLTVSQIDYYVQLKAKVKIIHCCLEFTYDYKMTYYFNVVIF